MLRDGRGISIRLALLVGVVATAFSYLALRIWTGQGGTLLPTAWGGLIVLAFMACGVFSAGLPVRRFLRGRATKTLNPMRAMRTLVLAQACALTGTLVTGWYIAQLLLLLPYLDIASRRSLAIRLAALAAGGVLMVVAGLAVQAMCRVDKGGGDQNSHPDRYSEEDRDGARDRDREDESR